MTLKLLRSVFVSDKSRKTQSTCRWHRRKEERPAEILQAALKSFTAKGYASTKLDDVAKQAGLSKGTLYLYFESKEVLFKAVVREFVVPQIAKAEEQAENYSGSMKDLINLLVEQWKANVLENELSGMTKLIMAEASNFPELAKFYLTNVIQRTRNFVSRLIKIGIEKDEFKQCDADLAARAFLTPMVFSAIWQHSLAPFDEKYDVNEYLNFHMDIFLHGILKDQPE